MSSRKSYHGEECRGFRLLRRYATAPKTATITLTRKTTTLATRGANWNLESAGVSENEGNISLNYRLDICNKINPARSFDISI